MNFLQPALHVLALIKYLPVVIVFLVFSLMFTGYIADFRHWKKFGTTSCKAASYGKPCDCTRV